MSHPVPARRLPARTLVTAVLLTILVLAAASGAGAAGLGAPRPTTGPTAAGGPPGGWQRPAEGNVLELFDPPARPWLPGHRGVDLAAPAGTAVVAPASGVVTFAGRVGGKPVVVVSHGELRSTFEPVEAVAGVGVHVGAGEPVGQVSADPGPSHCAADGCLHWGVRRGETYLDPLALLGLAAPIVLLPVPGA